MSSTTPLPKDDLSKIPEGISGPLQLAVHIKAKDGKEQEVAEWLSKIQAYANTDKEPDTNVYRVSRAVEGGGAWFLVYEEYKNAEAMKHHTQGQDFKTFFSKAGELLEVIHPRW